MAIDAYVSFGKPRNEDDTVGPHDTPRPFIDGDSTDADHYWWCELRDCGFNLENPHPPVDEKNDDEKSPELPASHFEPVTLRKRVDWATTQLFQLCCQAAVAKAQKPD